MSNYAETSKEIYAVILEAINRGNANIITFENGHMVERIPTDEQIADEVFDAINHRILAWR